MLSVESLERRTLLAADLANGVLTVLGTKAPDLIELEMAGADLSVSLNGNVQLFNAADVLELRIHGSGGNDTITIADDVLIDAWVSGGKGHDEIDGGGGNDVLDGEKGNDLIRGDDGDDEIHGGVGHDSLHGGAGDDDMYGDAGHDDLFGDDGNDDLDGGLGNDDCLGGNDDDVIHGGPGNDLLDGEDGDDLLDGDLGDDTELDGLTADLDVELEATLNGGGAHGEAEYEVEQDEDGTEVELEVVIAKALPGSVLDVLVDGFLAGQIVVDEFGWGQLKLSSDPDDPDEAAFPDGFPEIGDGSLVTVGDVISGVFSAESSG